MKSDSAKSFVIVILILQVVATALLWILNVLSVETTGAFAVLLAADLIAFAIVLQIYRNPGSVDSTPEAQAEPEKTTTMPAAAAAAGASSGGAMPAAPAAPVAQVVAAPQPTMHARSEDRQGAVYDALPRIIHIGLPIASFLVILAFAVVTFLPPDKATLPPTSTTLFIPIYLAIVVTLVFGSMYLFKRLMDTEAEPSSVPA